MLVQNVNKAFVYNTESKSPLIQFDYGSFPSQYHELYCTECLHNVEQGKNSVPEMTSFLPSLLYHKIHPEESVPTPFYLHRSIRVKISTNFYKSVHKCSISCVCTACS